MPQHSPAQSLTLAEIGPGIALPSTASPFAGRGLGRSIAVSIIWIAALAACAGFAILALSGAGLLDSGRIVVLVSRLEPTAIAVVLALSIANYLLRGLRWHLMTLELAPDIRLRSSLGYYLAGFAFLPTPAKLGEAVRLWLLKSRHDVAYARSVGLLVLDRLVDLTCLVALATAGLIAGSPHWAPIATILGILAPAILLVSSRRRVVWLASCARRALAGRGRKLFRFALTTDATVRSIACPPLLAKALALGTAAWMAQITGIWIVLGQLGFVGSVNDVALIYPVAMLGGGATLVPGTADAVLVGMLSLAGMTLEAAVTATIVGRLATYWFAWLVGIAVAAFVLPFRTSPAATLGTTKLAARSAGR